MASDEVPIPEPAIGVGPALGADIEVEKVAALLPLAERSFNVATDQPRTHVPPPSAILRFKGFISGLDDDTLLREPIEHISTDASTVIARRIDGYSSISGPRRWYERFPAEVFTLVDAAGFGPFYCGALTDEERWWDTTNSFHFSSTREMTLTPYDFSMLTGLRVGRDTQLQLLGAIPDTTNNRMYTRGFLIYLLGTTLFANRENIVGLYILEALVHLPWVADYDWGGTGLASLYCYMSSISRCKFWVYTYFTSLAPVPVRSVELSVPHFRYYNSRFKRRCLVDHTFPYFRRFFGTITADQTFICQTRGVADPDIPHPPPASMRLDLLMIGEDGDRYHEPSDFTTFLRTWAMAPLTPGVARVVPEVTTALATGASDVPIRGAPTVAPIPGLPVLLTEIVYMCPDGVIEQIPLEPIEKRDRRLVFARGVEQIPQVYSDELLRAIDRLVIMVQRRQTALPTIIAILYTSDHSI
ncbi:hypothetical protein CsSME_00036471 [Camellia sinensis var. sinensis]